MIYFENVQLQQKGNFINLSKFQIETVNVKVVDNN